MKLPIRLDPRFDYRAHPDGIYASFRFTISDGPPVFATPAPTRIVVVDPPLPAGGYVVGEDGTLLPVGDQPEVAYTFTALVDDLGALIELAPRTRAEFLALPDDRLVEYAASWLTYRAHRDGRDALSTVENDVARAYYVFTWIVWDGVAAVADSDELVPTAQALRRVALDGHGALLERASGAPPDVVDEFGSAWDRLDATPTAALARYLRDHADEVAWSKMIA